MEKPAAEVTITVSLVRQLLRSQHRDLAHLPITPAASGWDNAMFRLGPSLAVRLPRRQLGAALMVNEQTWLPLLAPYLQLPVPVPLRTGVADFGYPWRWSVVPWLAGETADGVALQAGEAQRFAMFLRSLHQSAPANAPANPYRGVPLAMISPQVTQRLDSLSTKTAVITPCIRALWQRALEAPAATELCWLHGDLHPHNVLASEGKLSAVIDWGDLTVGDAATDLAAIWMLFESASEREWALSAYALAGDAQGQSPAEGRSRAIGWAIAFATILLEAGLNHKPSFATIGLNTLRRVSYDG